MPALKVREQFTYHDKLDTDIAAVSGGVLWSSLLLTSEDAGVGQVDKRAANFSFAAGMMQKPLRHSEFEKTYKEKESDMHSTGSI